MQTKEIQGRLWSAAPAAWAKYLEPTFIPMYLEVLKKITLDEEKMLLDAGCGSGLFLSMAAATGAEVRGIDAAPGLLAIAKERLTGIPLQIEDLEDLPFIDGTFDIVTGFNSFQYAGSFENALAEARRVVKRHGFVVIGIWGAEEENEAAPVLRAVSNLLPASPESPGLFTLSEEGKVETVCQSVGLKIVAKEKVYCPWLFFGEEALQQAFLCTAPCVKAVSTVGETAVRAAIYDSAEPFRLTDDVYYMRNYFKFFIAEAV